MLDLLAAATHAEPEHAEMTAFGIGPGGYVALSMIVVLGIMLWKRVPQLLIAALDERIAGIRKQLDEAKALRAEAEKLRDDYARKAAEAEKDAEEMRAGAERNAAEIVEKAKADAAALIARHKAASADRIAAAERTALAELRAKAASVATEAAAALIAENHGEAADRTLADKVIAGL